MNAIIGIGIALAMVVVSGGITLLFMGLPSLGELLAGNPAPVLNDIENSFESW